MQQQFVQIINVPNNVFFLQNKSINQSSITTVAAAAAATSTTTTFTITTTKTKLKLEIINRKYILVSL